jgi:hypothetical protein
MSKKMFRSSKKVNQLDMFTSITGMLQGASYEQYNNSQAWHNMFRVHVVSRIDESQFKSLFNEKMGAPNASIRVLIGMITLKEAFGWSDSELFEHCRFNLLVRSALGLLHINDSIPAESTYYLFRKRIHDYQKEKQVDLIEKVFQQITSSQVLAFNVSGRSIRMDSKLIGSNIAFCTRYEIVHDTLVLFYNAMNKTAPIKLTGEDLAQLKELSETTGNKVVYHSTREEVQKRLLDLGVLCYKVLSIYEEKDNKYYLLLKRVFDEHFRLGENGQTELRPKEEIKSDSVQSPYDTECAYRNKDNKPVKGYSINATETCDNNSLNLITDIQTAPANKPDTEFVKPALDNTTWVLGHKPEDLHADGAFHSPDNVNHCQEEDINHYFTGMPGMPGRYDLTLYDDTLTVIDTQTGEIIPAYKNKSGKWSIKTEKGYRYFSDQQIENCQLRKQIEQVPVEKRNKRNNIEATIFQLSYYTRNNKTRYRGLIQHKIWALLRCIWINFKRIIAYVEQICQRTVLFNQIMPSYWFFSQKNRFENTFKRIFNLYYSFFKDLGDLRTKFIFMKLGFL